MSTARLLGWEVLCSSWFFVKRDTASGSYVTFFIHIQSNATRSLKQRSGTTEDSSTSYILFPCDFCSFLCDFSSNLDLGCFHTDAVCFELLGSYSLIGAKMTGVKLRDLVRTKQPNLGPKQKRRFWSRLKWTMVPFVSSVRAVFWEIQTFFFRFFTGYPRKGKPMQASCYRNKISRMPWHKQAKAARKWRNRNRQTSDFQNADVRQLPANWPISVKYRNNPGMMMIWCTFVRWNQNRPDQTLKNREPWPGFTCVKRMKTVFHLCSIVVCILATRLWLFFKLFLNAQNVSGRQPQTAVV